MKLKQNFFPVNRHTEDMSSLSKHIFCVHFFILHVIQEIIRVLLTASGYLFSFFQPVLGVSDFMGIVRKRQHINCWKYSIEVFLFYLSTVKQILFTMESAQKSGKVVELGDCKTVSSKTFVSKMVNYSNYSFFTVFGFRLSFLAVHLKYQAKKPIIVCKFQLYLLYFLLEWPSPPGFFSGQRRIYLSPV